DSPRADEGSGEAMSQKAAKAQEPSMEEILASIRRIISDDTGHAEAHEAPPARVAAPIPPPAPARATAPNPPPPPPPAHEADVLELTDVVETRVEPVFRPAQDPDVEFRDQPRRRPETDLPAASLPARHAFPDRIDEQLLSQRASEA